ncbi:MAG: hypothetical protein HC854_03650 [Flavobacterium sp.]|nr:hypothetical protein [Flavobacterium sp.]
METKKIVQLEKKTQQIQLVKGEFTPSEASIVIINLINEKINFHKLQRLQSWESNHNSNTEHIDSRIKELEREKEIAIDFINKTDNNRLNIKVNGILELTAINNN